MNILKNMKKNDWILLGIVLGAAAVFWAALYVSADKNPGYVKVSVDGKITGTYDLSEDQEVEINGGTNRMEIRDGKVKMTEASCPDQLCVHQRAISLDNESIICLPNKVVLQMESRDKAELDTVVK